MNTAVHVAVNAAGNHRCSNNNSTITSIMLKTPSRCPLTTAPAAAAAAVTAGVQGLPAATLVLHTVVVLALAVVVVYGLAA